MTEGERTVTERSSYSRVRTDNGGAVSTVHSFNLKTAQILLALVTSIIAVIGTSLSVTWWAIGPRLDGHVDARVHRYIAPQVIAAEAEHARIRTEFSVALTNEQQRRQEQLTRIEADLLYIRTRIDQLYSRGTR